MCNCKVRSLGKCKNLLQISKGFTDFLKISVNHKNFFFNFRYFTKSALKSHMYFSDLVNYSNKNLIKIFERYFTDTFTKHFTVIFIYLLVDLTDIFRKHFNQTLTKSY